MTHRVVTAQTPAHLEAVLNGMASQGWRLEHGAVWLVEGQFCAVMTRPSDWAAPFRCACQSDAQLHLVDALAAAMEAACADCPHPVRVRQVRDILRPHVGAK